MCSNMLIVYLQNTFKANEIMEEEYNSCISAVLIFGVLNNLTIIIQTEISVAKLTSSSSLLVLHIERRESTFLSITIISAVTVCMFTFYCHKTEAWTATFTKFSRDTISDEVNFLLQPFKR